MNRRLKVGASLVVCCLLLLSVSRTVSATIEWIDEYWWIEYYSRIYYYPGREPNVVGEARTLSQDIQMNPPLEIGAHAYLFRDRCYVDHDEQIQLHCDDVTASVGGREATGGVAWEIGADHWAYYREAVITRGSLESVFVPFVTDTSGPDYEAQAQAAKAKLDAMLVVKCKAIMDLQNITGTGPIPYLYLLQGSNPLTAEQRDSLWHILHKDVFPSMLAPGDGMPGITFLNEYTVGAIFGKVDGSSSVVTLTWDGIGWKVGD